MSTSDVYLHALPAWTSGTVSMLDGNERAIGQVAGLRRRVGQGVAKRLASENAYAHDDLAAVICGAIYLCTPIEREVVTDFGGFGVFTAPVDYVTELASSQRPGARGCGRRTTDARRMVVWAEAIHPAPVAWSGRSSRCSAATRSIMI